MLCVIRLRVRSSFGSKMERGEAYCPQRDGRICHQEQKRDHGGDLPRSGEHGEHGITRTA